MYAGLLWAIAGSDDEPSSKVRLEEAKVSLGIPASVQLLSACLSLLPRTCVNDGARHQIASA